MRIAASERERRDTTPGWDETSLQPSLAELWPRIAVCIQGSCIDRELYHSSVDAVLRQDYPGQVTLIVPDGAPDDLRCSSEDRRVTVVRRADPSLELACNTALEFALELQPAVEFVAVLSSGETAPPQWLSSLVQAQEDFDADLVMGSLKAVFKEPPPDWMLAGGFFDRCGNQRGPITRISARDNLLVRASIVRSLLADMRNSDDIHHDDEWAALEHRIKALALTSVWASDAVVFDVIPQSRMTMQWLIDREYRKGFSMARVRSARPSRHATMAGTSHAAITLGLRLADIVSHGMARIDKASSVRARLMLARARGLLAGARSHDARQGGIA
jgi:succinoglycan biosynthesis protein ExoM